VNIGHDLVCLFFLPSGNQKSWTFWDKPDKYDLEDRRKCLSNRWNAPRPVVVNVKSAKGQPGCYDATDIPGGVVDGREDSTVLWMGQLGDQQGRGSMSNGDTESYEEARGNEHSEIDTDTLKDNTKNPIRASEVLTAYPAQNYSHDNATSHDTCATTKNVGDVRDNGKRAD